MTGDVTSGHIGETVTPEVIMTGDVTSDYKVSM